jgi:uncharacterized BrkB/YihY/UPF0761 family membrane protein
MPDHNHNTQTGDTTMPSIKNNSMLILFTVATFALLSVMLPSSSHAQWEDRSGNLPKDDNTLTYVLLGVAGVALIVGIVVMSNSSHSTAPSDSLGIHVDSTKESALPQAPVGV